MNCIGLLRHGKTEGGNRFLGRTNDPLSRTGLQQMHSTMADFNQWDRIFSSPLQRCAAFASEFANSHDIPLTLQAGLMEIDFGDWDGLSAAELMESSPKALSDFWRDPLNHSPPGGESLLNFHNRVVEAWETICHHYQGQHLLMVTHGGVIRVLLSHLQGIPLDHLLEIEVKHASLFGLLLADGSLKQLSTSRDTTMAWLLD
jgi:alpha-ribazole phosphatase